MELAYMFLADAAEATTDGRFFVFAGGIEGARAHEFPTSMPTLAVVAKIRIAPEERDRETQIRLVVTDTTGEPVLAEINANYPPVPADYPRDQPAYRLVVVNFHGLSFPHPGRYMFTLYANEVRIGSVLFVMVANVPT
jgi:hypothetical protein